MPNDVLWLLRLEGTFAHDDYWAFSYAIIVLELLAVNIDEVQDP